MKNDQSQSAEDRRANALRRRFKKLSPLPGKHAERPTHPTLDLKLPRFRGTGAQVDGASFHGRLINMRLGISLNNRVSLVGEPFVELSASSEPKPIARWPMFPVIGGENGPSHVDGKNFSLDVIGGQGRLSLVFSSPQSNPVVPALTRAFNWLKELFSKSVISRPKDACRIDLSCNRLGRDDAEFLVQSPPRGWKVSA